MSLVVTEAIVLHAFDYRETSRILRLATREAGVRSVIAHGARRPKNRFGAALDLFAEGTAHIVVHATKDLHTLSAFDVTRAKTSLAGSWSRFAAANALSEIMLRFARDDANPELFATFAAGLDALERTDNDSAATGLAAAWALVAELGFAPSMDACVSCGSPLPDDAPVRFSHRAGGVVCAVCAAQAPTARLLPPDARATIREWVAGGHREVPDRLSTLAHLRLLREFLHEHLADEKPLRAFAVWERGDWSAR